MVIVVIIIATIQNIAWSILFIGLEIFMNYSYIKYSCRVYKTGLPLLEFLITIPSDYVNSLDSRQCVVYKI